MTSRSRQPASLAAVRAELSRDPGGAGCKCTFTLSELVVDSEQRTIVCPSCGTHLPPFDVSMWLFSEREDLLDELESGSKPTAAQRVGLRNALKMVRREYSSAKREHGRHPSSVFAEEVDQHQATIDVLEAFLKEGT